MLVRTRCLTGLAALAALVGSAGASAATRTADTGATASRPAAAKTMSMRKTRGAGVVMPVQTAGNQIAAISAFPTGGKGSGTEATCGLWSDRLQEDQNAQDDATDHQDVIDATNTLNQDVDNALDAGCAVIYAMVTTHPAGANRAETVKTVSIARSQPGAGGVTSTWTAGPSVAMISAFPTGGKGSGTEATCGLWSQRLQEDQQLVDDAPETDKDDASGPLNQDVDNALDAGCVVIY